LPALLVSALHVACTHWQMGGISQSFGKDSTLHRRQSYPSDRHGACFRM